MDDHVIDYTPPIGGVDEVATLKKRIVELENELRPKREVNTGVDDLKLTYVDLGISAEEIFEIIERYTLTVGTIFLTKEKLSKIIQHHIVRGMRRCRDGRTFSEVLDLRINNLKGTLAKLRESVGGNRPDQHTELEIARIEISIRNLVHAHDAAISTERTSEDPSDTQ
jgi:polyhydroxyalkanoate synthesis regulator phasin